MGTESETPNTKTKNSKSSISGDTTTPNDLPPAPAKRPDVRVMNTSLEKSLGRLNHILQKQHRINQAADHVFNNFCSPSGTIDTESIRACVVDLSKALIIEAPDEKQLASIQAKFFPDDKPFGKVRFRTVYRSILIHLKGIFSRRMEASHVLERQALYVGGWRELPTREDISRYLAIHQVLGKGAFGKVSIANDLTRYGRVVVVKQVLRNHPHYRSVGQSDAALQTEINLLMSTDHPNVVVIYDVYSDPKYHYIVMEHLNGGDLDNIIPTIDKRTGKMRRISQQFLCGMMRQILDGVSYIHTIGILHMDLKPANIMLAHKRTKEQPNDLQPTVKLVDFGLAHELDVNQQTTSGGAGTPLYQPPEVQIIKRKGGRARVSRASDVWAIGIIMYELFTGFHPFDLYRQDPRVSKDKRLDCFLDNVLDPKYMPRPYNIPQLAYDLILRLLERDPARRITARDALRHPWFQMAAPPTLPKEVVSSFIDRLKTFSRMNVLQVAILNLAAHHLTYDSADVISLFKQVDVDNDGVIQTRELARFLEKHGVSKTAINRICLLMDADNSESVSCSEFIAACHGHDDAHQLAMRIAFKELDSDGDGQLKADDFNVLFNNEIAAGDLQEMLSFMDTNSDGKVSWKELSDSIYTLY